MASGLQKLGTGPEVPAVIAEAGERAAERFAEFFAVEIRSPNTRRAYSASIGRFLDWCEERGLELEAVQPPQAAAYIETLCRTHSTATVKLHLAALRRLFDYLVVGQVVPYNPFHAVRGPRLVVRRGKTPVLPDEDLRAILGGIRTDTVVGLRDRAIIGVMLFAFARVGAVVKMTVEDYERRGPDGAFLTLHEKGGRFHRVPVHHQAGEYLDSYLEQAQLTSGALWRSTPGRSAKLTDRPLSSEDVLRMVKRRAVDAGVVLRVTCHSFRASGITSYLKHGGTLETAAAIAGHASTRTTQLYDRRMEEITRSEIERIRI